MERVLISDWQRGRVRDALFTNPLSNLGRSLTPYFADFELTDLGEFAFPVSGGPFVVPSPLALEVGWDEGGGSVGEGWYPVSGKWIVGPTGPHFRSYQMPFVVSFTVLEGSLGSYPLTAYGWVVVTSATIGASSRWHCAQRFETPQVLESGADRVVVIPFEVDILSRWESSGG